MDVRIFTEPQQGASYDDLLRLAKAAEDDGFEGFFRSDHYLAVGSGDGDGEGRRGLPGPTDAWITLAGLARETSRIRLGTLVSPLTFRLPGPLAIQVAQVDAMSAGRVELALGTGWFAAEHEAYGIPFPARRFDLLEEQLEIITGLWTIPVGERFSHDGAHYRLVDSPALPKPVQRPHPPIIVGGGGPRRTPALAARFASELNLAFQPPERLAPGYDRARAACEAIGRDPATLTLSVALTTCVGKDDAEVDARCRTTGFERANLEVDGLAGTPGAVVERIGQYAELGVTRIYLQTLDITDLDHLELIAAEVLPQL